MGTFDQLIGQIDAFIRKFYKNQLLKGLLLFVGFFVMSYLLVVTLEFFGHFNSWIRGFLLLGFLLVNGFIFIRYILQPLLKLRSFGERISRYQASVIIGRFFPQVSDRLVNTLQLKDQIDASTGDYELLIASVEQRSAALSSIPFSDAIDLRENKRYFPLVFGSLFFVLLLGLFAPAFLWNGTERVVRFNEEFVPEAPFSFEVVANSFQIKEGEDFSFKVVLDGHILPEKVYIKSSQGTFLLNPESRSTFEGRLRQLSKSTDFVLVANGYQSKSFHVSVVGRTSLGRLQAKITYPSYLGMEDEVVENAGDLEIYEGAIVTWRGLAKNSKRVDFILGDSLSTFSKEGFRLMRTFLSSTEAQLVLTNQFTNERDTNAFFIEVIRDAYPAISVTEQLDSIKDGLRFFQGSIQDDHGLRSLSFVYTIERKNGATRSERLPVMPVSGTNQQFDFAVDFRREELELEDVVTYYFEVGDNDGINGSKFSRSRSFTYVLPTLEELNEKRSEDQKETRADFEKLLEKATDFRAEIDRVRKESLNSKKSNWTKSNEVQQLKQEHQSLMNELQDAKEEMNQELEEKDQLSEMDKELLEQQERINELLDELMDDELRELLNQLEELLKQNNKNALEENLEKLEMSSEKMKDQLDRSLEMLKRLQVNEKIDDLEEQLKRLSEEQKVLSKEMERDGKVDDEDKKKQEEINASFDKLKKEMMDLDSLNSALDRPMDLDPQEQLSEEISDELQDAKENLDKNKSKKAGESQKAAGDKMEQMAENLASMQNSSNQQQQQEDLESLRRILESLLILSLDQEALMEDFREVSDQDPMYRTYGRVQRRIVDDTKIVRDSLEALAKRQPMIARFIDDELNTLASNHELALSNIGEYNRRKTLTHQQFAMTAYNNLALLLNESLEQMQSQMQSMMPGSGSCNKPGGKGAAKPGDSPSPGDMKKMLQQQLEQMKKGMNPGGKEPGDNEGVGTMGGGMSNKEISKMAAQQSAIRKRLEELRNELNKDGKGSGNHLSPLILELEQQEKDLVNKRINASTVERQHRILTRLLESEKALMERGLEEKRESKEGKSENLGNQIRFDEYNKEKLKQIELLRAVDPSYNKYYKDKASEYFNKGI